MMMMSDGALSQAEIDALLAGVDSSSGGSAPAAVATAPGGSTDPEQLSLQSFLSSTVGAQSSNLSMMTGATVSLSEPKVSFSGRDNLLSQLPDTVTVVKADFTSGFPGEHLFVLSEECAKAIASLMNKEENIELDEMAMSVIGEVVSQMVGHQITALTDKTGNKSIASASPEAANVPKGVAALPGGSFSTAVYDVDLGDGINYEIWEVFGSKVSSEIAKALISASTPQAASSGKGTGAAPGMNMGGMQMPMGMGGMQMPMGMGGMQMPMGMGMMGGGMPNMGAANVQAVQFPNLMQPMGGTMESGNISLIMDVFMEMTVELGRTKKLIKEILSMGEGTIIELDKLAGEPVDILVNHKLIAKGEVVVIDENFGVRVTEIVSPMERMNDMS